MKRFQRWPLLMILILVLSHGRHVLHSRLRAKEPGKPAGGFFVHGLRAKRRGNSRRNEEFRQVQTHCTTGDMMMMMMIVAKKTPTQG
ncbi:hypothetical protein F3Y22_tig00110548pilonHSYRG00805 [Hibiscus syriacus]|uniref:Secreted protein n=1 Tax=Hibiscus syriacus TaxID=106335 RepID=A0A6A3AA72_HIBSY|nr:hypothetical protein F3Y22_tig00110548pilonHSYRG00805 [Hibiscus syriacus]